MRPLNVVVAQLDSKNADRLAASFYCQLRSVAVAVARSLEELRDSIPKHHADAAIVDLELVSLPDLQDLHQNFRDTTIVCTHRVADEEMWTSALAAGASDMCCSSDVDGIVHSTLHNLDTLTTSQAA